LFYKLYLARGTRTPKVQCGPQANASRRRAFESLPARHIR